MAEERCAGGEQRLAALGPGDALLPGIMKTGPAVCRVRKRADKKGSKLVGATPCAPPPAIK